MSGLWGTLVTSQQAMMAQSHSMHMISQNVSNTNTTGYKSVESHFATLLNHNSPQQGDFFSVQTQDRKFVENQGLLQPTDSTFDMALDGQGMLMVTDDLEGGDIFYTRDGALQTPVADQEEGSFYLTNGSGNYLLGWQADENGDLPDDKTEANLQPLVIDGEVSSDGVATTELTAAFNLPPDQPLQATAFAVYDGQGNTENLNMVWNKADDALNTWDVTLSASNGTVTTGNGTDTVRVTFDSNGELISVDGDTTATGFTMDFAWDEAEATQVVFDMAGSTQFAGTYEQRGVTNDGYGPGVMESFAINEDGLISVGFSNGTQRVMGQVAVADFVNANQLEQLSGTMYRQTQASGEATVHDLTESLASTQIMNASLERSNVDLADQFTRMMVTQKAYSAASKTYVTADEMVQTARDLKR